MKNFALIILITLLASGCNGQQGLEAEEKDQQKDKQKSELNQPKVSWKINKETDENGNIIKYDSTYTWSYSNIKGDSLVIDADSLMQSFNMYFNENFPTIWQRSFTWPLDRDSLLYRDFHRQDYFHNRWQQDFFEMDMMFKRMDSMRNQFFYDQYPGLLEPPEPADKKKE